MAPDRIGEFEGQAWLGGSAPHRLLQWYLGRIASGVADGLPDEVAALFTSEASPAVLAGFMAERFDDLRGFRLVEVIDRSDAVAVAVVETPAGVRWRAGALADPVSGRFRRVGSARAPAPGVTIRRAEPDDGTRIADMVRGAPIASGADTLLLDYGPDYLEATAMAADRVTLIAELDGVVIGLHGMAAIDLRHGADVVRFEYIRHTRVLPSAKGSGVFSALNGALFEVSIESDSSSQPMSLVVLANDAMLTHLPPALRRWGTPWERFHIDTATQAQGPAPPVVADLSDAGSLITAAQGEPGLAVVPSADWLTARLGSTPSLYGPDRLRGNRDALLGVGTRTVSVQRTGSSGGAYREAIAFDIGNAPGAGPALEEVVRGWCSQLASEGVDRLAIACGTASPVRDVVASMASEHEVFLLNCGLGPPEGAVPSIAFDHAVM